LIISLEEGNKQDSSSSRGKRMNLVNINAHIQPRRTFLRSKVARPDKSKAPDVISMKIPEPKIRSKCPWSRGEKKEERKGALKGNR
jgi:hypothetical protein